MILTHFIIYLLCAINVYVNHGTGTTSAELYGLDLFGCEFGLVAITRFTNKRYYSYCEGLFR